jgi:hypothetical protein
MPNTPWNSMRGADGDRESHRHAGMCPKYDLAGKSARFSIAKPPNPYRTDSPQKNDHSRQKPPVR